MALVFVNADKTAIDTEKVEALDLLTHNLFMISGRYIQLSQQDFDRVLAAKQGK